MTFDGETYVAERDGSRLRAQLDRVQRLMADGVWRTLGEIAEATGDASDAAISARLRDLRKPRFGGFVVERRHRGDGGRGLYEYRVTGGGPPVARSARPTRAELRQALGELRALVRGQRVSPELVTVGRWLAALAGEAKT